MDGYSQIIFMSKQMKKILSSRNLNKSNSDSPQLSVERLDQTGITDKRRSSPFYKKGCPKGDSAQAKRVPIWLSVFIILILSFFIFWGANYTKTNLASLFSVITARVAINPLEARVYAPAEVEINKIFKLEAGAINKGEEKIEKAEAEIFLPEGLVLLRKEPVREIGAIPGKKEKRTSWQAQGEKEGSYIVSVKVSGELREEVIGAEDSVLVEIKESVKKTGTQNWFQNFFDFFR